MSYLTELALRTAANNSNKVLTALKDPEEIKQQADNIVDGIKNKALQRANQLIQTYGDISSKEAQIAVATTAIGIAITGIAYGYQAILTQLRTLKKQRLRFEKERQAGIATFLIPTHKEPRDHSKEERTIKAFLQLMNDNPVLLSYSGIHSTELQTEKAEKFYSVVPFYRMSGHLDHEVASLKPLDKQRASINLFLRSALPKAITDIESHFQADHKFISYFEAKFEKKNYLNDRRAPRFILMALSNLLWNLLHPVDPDSCLLSNHKCIELCSQAEFLLAQLLNQDAAVYVKPISNDENELMPFILKLKNRIKALKDAYIDAEMHELNIQDISNSAHSVLRVIAKSIFRLIYKREDPQSKLLEVEDNAAESIADTVYYLNLLLRQNPELIESFLPVPSRITNDTVINNPPTTIMDLLIIFCHLTWRERDELFDRLIKNNKSSAIEFNQTLSHFDERFIQPLREISKTELDTSIFMPNHIEVSRLTARRLIPFITLVLKDYRVDADLLTKTLKKKSSPSNTASATPLSGNQQIKAINRMAEAGNGYYAWALSPFVLMSVEIATEVDKLPRRLYRLTQVTELLDNLAFLIENYHHFLQNASFQAFMLKCLAKIKEEYETLFQHIAKVDNSMAHDERLSHTLKAILSPMTKILNERLGTFTLAAANFERIVSTPDFTEQQRKLLETKLNTISEQFYELFGEESGISLLTIPPEAQLHQPLAKSHTSDVVDTKMVILLKDVVQRCYNALSYQSSTGHKGVVLRELLQLINEKPHFTPAQIKHVVLELTRITASYRETWLFQAAYGETRSARTLIESIKDPKLNAILPLAEIIFGQAIDVKELGDAQILHRLKHLRQGNFWQESSSKIKLLPFSIS